MILHVMHMRNFKEGGKEYLNFLWDDSLDFGIFSDIPPIVLGHISKFRYLQCHLICLLC